MASTQAKSNMVLIMKWKNNKRQFEWEMNKYAV